MEANNMKAMREALEEIYLNAQYICDYKDEPDIVRHRADIIERAVNAALAKPARNCDVEGVAEQEDRFEKFCDAHKHVGDDGANWCSCDCPCYNATECGIRWAQMPYEGEAK